MTLYSERLKALGQKRKTREGGGNGCLGCALWVHSSRWTSAFPGLSFREMTLECGGRIYVCLAQKQEFVSIKAAGDSFHTNYKKKAKFCAAWGGSWGFTRSRGGANLHKYGEYQLSWALRPKETAFKLSKSHRCKRGGKCQKNNNRRRIVPGFARSLWGKRRK